MLTGLAFVNVHTVFPVVLRDYIPRITSADVAAVGDVVALMRAATAVGVGTVMTVI